MSGLDAVKYNSYPIISLYHVISTSLNYFSRHRDEVGCIRVHIILASSHKISLKFILHTLMLKNLIIYPFYLKSKKNLAHLSYRL